MVEREVTFGQIRSEFGGFFTLSVEFSNVDGLLKYCDQFKKYTAKVCSIIVTLFITVTGFIFFVQKTEINRFGE